MDIYANSEANIIAKEAFFLFENCEQERGHVFLDALKKQFVKNQYIKLTPADVRKVAKDMKMAL